MAPHDFLEYTLKRPFEPFEVQVSDGTKYVVRHPELCMVGFESASSSASRRRE